MCSSVFQYTWEKNRMLEKIVDVLRDNLNQVQVKTASVFAEINEIYLLRFLKTLFKKR